VTHLGPEAPNLTLISPAQKRRLIAASVVLLAVALLGLASKAKTSHYSPGSHSAAYFSSSVKIAQKAHPLRALLATPLLPSAGLPPVAVSISRAETILPVAMVSRAPLLGLRPLRAPPLSIS